MDKVTHPPHEVYAQASNYLSTTCPLLVGPHHNKWYIWNMDQTLLYFPHHRSNTLAKQGTKTIHIRKT